MLVAGNTANGVLDILHEWKIHSAQDSERLPPSLEQGCQHVLVCEGCENRFMPEGTGIPSSLCCFPHGAEDSNRRTLRMRESSSV